MSGRPVFGDNSVFIAFIQLTMCSCFTCPKVRTSGAVLAKCCKKRRAVSAWWYTVTGRKLGARRTSHSSINAPISGCAAFKSADGYVSYDAVTAAQRQQIAAKAKALATALDGIDPALGLSGL